MAFIGVVFEVYREIEYDGKDEGKDEGYSFGQAGFGCLKMGDGGAYIKMDKKDSEGKYQLSMTLLKDRLPPPEC